MTFVYCCILTEDYTQLLSSSRDLENGDFFILITAASGAIGIFITLSIVCAITTVGPIAVNISGTVKDALLTYLSFIYFEDQ